ncbi:hypothetical protein CPB84DRAFT_1691896 [Gymnopilus junonius]|uniref:BTB domain-containing protein n=1 Tax=Gymnopilus junonius TaxID=109634 RepID=A0A9P5N889_GYMJU|nr:hypothetical protein CPB84DRAFT_1691896 [Gymnopilus junonius]
MFYLRKSIVTSLAEPSKVVRSPIWFDDGSIVLQVENTQFRVHRAILSKHSEILEGLFTVPQPKDQPLVEGCVIVQFPDKAEDWEGLLSYIYEGKYHELDNLPIQYFVSILRLGNKYFVKAALDRCMANLKYNFALTESVWDATFHPAEKEEAKKELKDWYSERVIDILNISEELKIRTVLPTAYLLGLLYLTLAKMESQDDIVCGRTRKDGTHAQLDNSIKLTLLRARDTMAAEFHPRLFNWILHTTHTIPCTECQSASACRESRANLFKKMFADFRISVHIATTLAPWDNSYARGLCMNCTAAANIAFNAAHSRIWTNLPSHFGLPNWDDLKDFAD